MPATSTAQVTAPDGAVFDAHLAVPDEGSGPGVLVIQEVFGVNTYIELVCRRLASIGFVALAPDVFFRQQPGFAVDRGGPEAVGAGVKMAQGHDHATGQADLGAALAHLRGLESTAGRRCGVMGFCFGGFQTFMMARHHRPDAAVSYYGSGIATQLDGVAEALTCPILFHFGDNDPFLPNRDVDAIREATAAMGNVTVRQHWMGGHAFDNVLSPFYQPHQAQLAWGETTAFLTRHLG